MIYHRFSGLDLCRTDPAQHLISQRQIQDLDYLDDPNDLNDLDDIYDPDRDLLDWSDLPLLANPGAQIDSNVDQVLPSEKTPTFWGIIYCATVLSIHVGSFSRWVVRGLGNKDHGHHGPHNLASVLPLNVMFNT